MNNQMTTAIRLHDGSVPVNENTQVERVVIQTADGLSLQAVLDDFEARITVLEP